MEGLDKRLEEVLIEVANSSTVTGLELESIKQAFKDAGWFDAEQRDKVQHLVNQMAQTAQDMAKLPLTVREPGMMTGREWYDRFQEEFEKLVFDFNASPTDTPDIAAKRASGIDSETKVEGTK